MSQVTRNPLLISRVRESIRERGLFSRGETVVVAVSGGPDSLTLLDILRELAPELQIALHVAHLNHQLRGAESDADAEFVAQLAREWKLRATIQSRDVGAYAREHHHSIEEAARVVRYRFLAEVAAQVGAQIVAVAHNADDQVETVLMHFLRGAGLSGLRGMEYKSRLLTTDNRLQMNLVRPLLDVTRTEIEIYCRENNLQPRLDASNLDTTIYRNRLRHEVLPYLEQFNPNLRAVLRRSAASMADDYEYLRAQVFAAFEQVATLTESAFVFDREKWRALQPSLQRATLREAIHRLRYGLRNVNWAHIENARRVALENDVGAEASLPQHLVLVVGYGEFTVGETLPLPDMPLLHGVTIPLRVGATVELPESEWKLRVVDEPPPLIPPPLNGGGRGGGWSAQFDADKIRGELVLRTRRAGERFEPCGLAGHHKSLHEFMIDEKISRHIRDLIPILADDEKILWVCGWRVDERAKVTGETKNILRGEFFRELG